MRAPSPLRRRRHRQEAASSPAAGHAPAPVCDSPTRWRGKYHFDNAVGFLAGARHLVSASDPHSRENFLELIGCAVELALKSYLHFAGWNDDRCRAEVQGTRRRGTARISSTPSGHADADADIVALLSLPSHPRAGEARADAIVARAGAAGRRRTAGRCSGRRGGASPFQGLTRCRYP